MPTPAFLTVPSLSVPIGLPSLATRIFRTVSGASEPVISPAASAVPPSATTRAASATANAGLSNFMRLPPKSDSGV